MCTVAIGKFVHISRAVENKYPVIRINPKFCFALEHRHQNN